MFSAWVEKSNLHLLGGFHARKVSGVTRSTRKVPYTGCGLALLGSMLRSQLVRRLAMKLVRNARLGTIAKDQTERNLSVSQAITVRM